MLTPAAAADVAYALLAEPLPRRWQHTEGVARAAARLAPLAAPDAELLEAAAWLHDIGYAPGVQASDLHALDGARYLRDQVIGEQPLWALVAHHTGALVEAEERGLSQALTVEFPLPEQRGSRLLSLLTYADLTTDPYGNETTVDARLDEILERYEAEDPVHRALRRSGPGLRAEAERVGSQRAKVAPEATPFPEDAGR